MAGFLWPQKNERMPECGNAFISCRFQFINPIYAIDPELFDFHLFRFSFGETSEEAIRK
jgi:hypothetical protein